MTRRPDLEQLTNVLEAKVEPKAVAGSVAWDKVESDLASFRQLALDMGAADAAVVRTPELVIDERVRAKCMYPKCKFYGNNANCPPHAPDLEFARKLVSRYAVSLAFCVKGDPAEFTGTDFLKNAGRGNRAKESVNAICTAVESRAFYEGYYLSLALGQGPCKSFWCADQPCSAIGEERSCRFPLKARSSLEALGIDAFKLAADQGWEIFPCGRRVQAAQLPHILLVGLILVV